MAIVRTVYRRKRLPPRKPAKVVEEHAATQPPDPSAQPSRIIKAARKRASAPAELPPNTPRQQEWWDNRIREMMAGRGERKWGDVPPED